MAGPAGLRNTSSAIAPALLYHLHPCRRVFRPSGRASHVQNRSRRFCRTSKFCLTTCKAIYKNPLSRTFIYGWAGRIRTCACQDQNLVPYRLATAQQRYKYFGWCLAQLPNILLIYYLVETPGLDAAVSGSNLSRQSRSMTLSPGFALFFAKPR